MRKLWLAILGFIPLAIGCVMNWLMMTFSQTVFPYILISIAFLAFWAWLGFISYKFNKEGKAIFFIHLPAVLALVLNLYQEVVLGHYWGNLLGICTQFFFLPVLNVSYLLTSWSSRLWSAYIAGFLLMCLTYFIGYALKKRQTI